MAIQYASPIKNLFMGAGISKCILGLADYLFIFNPTYSASRAITLYSGIQPTADTIVSNWSSYNTNYLVHWVNIPLYHYNPESATPIFTNAALPAPVTSTNPGTASWAIVWAGNPAAGTGAGQIGNATIPTTGLMVVPVTDVFGNGVIKMSSTTILAATSYMFLDFTLYSGGP